MELTKDLKKRFCKDNNLSVQVFEEPYFMERIELLGEKDRYVSFCTLIETMFDGSEEKYFEAYNSLKDNIIDNIKNSKAFIALNSDDMNLYAINTPFRQGDVYKQPFIGKEFLSIDIRKANFSSLVHYGLKTNNKFFDSFDWGEYIAQFTDISHFKDSKYIRQVVFGNCNPKRQVTYEKYVIYGILKRILEIPGVEDKHVCSLCSDEIVLCLDGMTKETISSIWNLIEKDISLNEIPLKVEYFLLGKVTNTDAYVKRVYDTIEKDSYEDVIKCASSYDVPFIYRKLRNEEPNPHDLVFLHGERLATFLEYPNIEFDFEKKM